MRDSPSFFSFRPFSFRLFSFRLNSLQNRFLLLIIVVLAVTGFAATWLVSRAIREHFQMYLSNEAITSRAQRQELQKTLPTVVQKFYNSTDGWESVLPLLQQLGDLTNERIVLLDINGLVLLDSAQALKNQPDYTQLDGAILPIIRAGEPIGSIYLTPIVNTTLSSSQRTYIAEMNNALIQAVAGAGVIALLLTLLVTRNTLKPVQALTYAVRRMRDGELNQRVKVMSQDELGELALAFNEMSDNLARIEQLRRAMVSDVAHELRTPLSNIRGYLEAIQDGVVEPAADTINSLHEEALLLNRMVEDLQLLALADSGHLPLNPQLVVISEVVEKAVQAEKHKTNGSEIQLKTNLAPDLPIVEIDAGRIGQVLRNLLNNAFTHTNYHGQIVVNAYRDKNSVKVSVYNTGQGIPPEHLPYVFERFYRVDKSRTRTTGGSGLGLAIVKQIVEMHGGRVWVQSRPGIDAEFGFVLPIRPY